MDDDGGPIIYIDPPSSCFTSDFFGFLSYHHLWFLLKLADIVWFPVTLLKVYEVTAPTELPSTVTLATWWPVEGEMVKLWLEP